MTVGTDKFEIDVLGSGAVILGPEVTCDGFHRDREVRVQTHTHSDHMGDFDTSKSRELVMSPVVRELLTYDYPDFDFRSNIHVLNAGETYCYGSSTVSVLPAGHMLGACQVAVELSDGIRLGYSGDFSWPLDSVIKVDALVVDATYGKPSSDRRYSQQEAEERFVDLVRKQLRFGPVHLMANSAVIERALMVLAIADLSAPPPIIASRRLCESILVHQKHGWPIDNAICQDSPEGHAALSSDQYIRCWKLAEGGRVDGIVEGTTIRLTKYRADDPVFQYADRCFTVGLSSHADFNGTLEYVERSGATFVVTDNYRGRNDRGRVLANAIQQELRISAKPSTNLPHRRWGL